MYWLYRKELHEEESKYLQIQTEKRKKLLLNKSMKQMKVQINYFLEVKN